MKIWTLTIIFEITHNRRQRRRGIPSQNETEHLAKWQYFHWYILHTYNIIYIYI